MIHIGRLSDARDLRPGCASIRRAQNSQSVIRIGRAVGLARAHQNYVAVTRLQSNRPHRQRGLIVDQCLPGDRSGIGIQAARVRRSPKAAIRSAQKHGVSTSVRRINQHGSSPPRNPVVILHPISGSIRGERSRPHRHPATRARPRRRSCVRPRAGGCPIQALLGWGC
jgi:hypothetical protein